jgi:two-component sensor histidine kinase
MLPCALMVNELTTNAFKYAFSEHSHPILKISMKKEKKLYEMCIRDNGSGLKSDIDIDKTNTLGLKLINSIAKRQLRGELEYKYDKGAVFTIRF